MNLSDPTKSIQNGDDIGKWVCEVLDGMGIDKTSVVAHSAGGYAALHFVIFAQERVNRLVLLAPAASFVPFHKQFFVRLLLINLIRKEKIVNHFFWKWFITKENRYLLSEFNTKQFFIGMCNYKWSCKPVIPSVIPEEKLKTIKVPTLLLIGDHEVIYNPNKVMARAKELIPHLKGNIIKGANHVLFMELAETVNDEMIGFLTTNDVH
jgi:pimeloyl-ACP methyl ester carboxylesterase